MCHIHTALTDYLQFEQVTCDHGDNHGLVAAPTYKERKPDRLVKLSLSITLQSTSLLALSGRAEVSG